MSNFILNTLMLGIRVAIWVIAFYLVCKLNDVTISNDVQAIGSAVGLIAAMTYKKEDFDG